MCVNSKWSDTAQIPLDHHISTHRQWYQEIRNSAKTISNLEIPKDYERLTWIIKGMNYSDQKLGIRVEKVETDTDPSGMRNTFDRATTFMVAVDPVQTRMKEGVTSQREDQDCS